MFSRHVLTFIQRHGLFVSLDRVLIGVSGGPDSTALLYVLNDLKVPLGITIMVAHCNHGLRGRASDLDERFVATLCERCGVDFVSKKMKPSSARSRLPNEASLREGRLNFLFDTAKKFHIDTIALGHTLDDQAETVLMRLIRGSGLYGLISMMPKRKISSHLIVRPLLGTSRPEINRYLAGKGVKPRIDQTNTRQIFLRNKIRHSILKGLVRINPHITQMLARFAEQAAIDYDFLYREAAPFIIESRNSNFSIRLATFNRLHEALQRMVIRVALERCLGNLRTFTHAHWDEIKDLARNRPEGSVVHLTRGVMVERRRKEIVIYLKEKNGRNARSDNEGLLLWKE